MCHDIQLTFILSKLRIYLIKIKFCCIYIQIKNDTNINSYDDAISITYNITKEKKKNQQGGAEDSGISLGNVISVNIYVHLYGIGCLFMLAV